jgi:hypothetical protein
MNTEFLATRKKQFYQIAKEGPREEPVKLKSPRNSKRVRILGKIASTPNSRARAAEIEQAEFTKEKKNPSRSAKYKRQKSFRNSTK